MSARSATDTNESEWRRVASSGSFEECLASLDEIVSFLETGGASLEASVEAYELGVAIGRRCEDLIGQAELRISQIEIPRLRTGSAASDEDDDLMDDDQGDGAEDVEPF